MAAAAYVNDWWAGRAAAVQGRALPVEHSEQFAAGYRSGMATLPVRVAASL